MHITKKKKKPSEQEFAIACIKEKQPFEKLDQEFTRRISD
jgi:hypothetical protein